MGYIMEHFNNNELLETLFYNIMMNLEHDVLVAPENNVMSQSLYDNNPIKMVISDEEKNKLLPIKYKDALQKEQNTACFITQDDFNDEDDIIQLPCNHCFTPDSIMHWLTEECAECPVCRYKFESVEKRVISHVDHNLNNSDHDSDDDSDLPDLIEINHPNLQNYPQFNNNIFLNNFINNMANENFFQNQFYFNINNNIEIIDDESIIENDDNEDNNEVD
jgi:Zn ribbon nucleic-acid-binding protein